MLDLPFGRGCLAYHGRKEMTRIRMIASDLDGTMLLNGALNLRPETCGLIQGLINEGIGFAASSGRQYDNLQNLFQPVRDQISYITQNGCVTYFNSRMISQELMDPLLGKEILQDIRRHPDLRAMATAAECVYADADDEKFLNHLREVVRVRCHPVERVEEISFPYSKISMFVENGVDDSEYWKKRYGDRCTVVPSDRQWLDFFPTGVSKAKGMRCILDCTGIDPEEVLVFGDNDNDLELFDLAGCAVTVSSAKESIRRRADTVTELVEHVLMEILNGKRNIEDWKK